MTAAIVPPFSFRPSRLHRANANVCVRPVANVRKSRTLALFSAGLVGTTAMRWRLQKSEHTLKSIFDWRIERSHEFTCMHDVCRNLLFWAHLCRNEFCVVIIERYDMQNGSDHSNCVFEVNLIRVLWPAKVEYIVVPLPHSATIYFGASRIISALQRQ